MPSYRLGAEELVELGRAPGGGAHVTGRAPYFVGRPRLGAAAGPSLSDSVKDVGGVIERNLGFALGTLSDLVKMSPAALAQGDQITSNAVSGLLEKVPAFGSLLAEIVVLGAASVKFGLPVQGISADGLKNILAGLSKALQTKNSSAQNDALVKEAMSGTLFKVQGIQRDSMKRVLEAR